MGSHGRKTAYHKSIDDAYQKGLDQFYRWCESRKTPDGDRRRFRTEMLAALAAHMSRVDSAPAVEGSRPDGPAVSQDGNPPARS
jgi:hypothetical protein